MIKYESTELGLSGLSPTIYELSRSIGEITLILFLFGHFESLKFKKKRNNKNM